MKFPEINSRKIDIRVVWCLLIIVALTNIISYNKGISEGKKEIIKILFGIEQKGDKNE